MVIGRASSTWRSSDGMVGMLRVGVGGRKQNAEGRGLVRHAPRSSTFSGRCGSTPSACAFLRCLLRAALLGGRLLGPTLLGCASLGAAFLGCAFPGATLPGRTLLRGRAAAAGLLRRALRAALLGGRLSCTAFGRTLGGTLARRLLRGTLLRRCLRAASGRLRRTPATGLGRGLGAP